MNKIFITMSSLKLITLAIFLTLQIRKSLLSEEVNKSQLTPLQEICLNELRYENKRDEFINLNLVELCPEDHVEYYNFMSCFWKKTGRQNEDGTINYDVLQKYIQQGIVAAIGDESKYVHYAEEVSNEVINTCKGDATKNNENVIKIRNCIVSEINKLGAK